jgi:hypothetical protein
MPYKISVFDVCVPKTPQRGSWCAGVTVRAVVEPTRQVSWHGGSRTFEGSQARLSISEDGEKLQSLGLDLHHVKGGNIEFFLGIDDDPAKAGTLAAADKVTFSFYPEEAAGGKDYWYQSGDWDVRIRYLVQFGENA